MEISPRRLVVDALGDNYSGDDNSLYFRGKKVGWFTEVSGKTLQLVSGNKSLLEIVDRKVNKEIVSTRLTVDIGTGKIDINKPTVVYRGGGNKTQYVLFIINLLLAGVCVSAGVLNNSETIRFFIKGLLTKIN